MPSCMTGRSGHRSGRSRQTDFGIHRVLSAEKWISVEIMSPSFPSPDELTHPPIGAGVAHVVAHDQLHAGTPSRLQYGNAVFYVVGNWFLDEHVEPAIEGSERLLEMEVIRRHEDDRIESFETKQLGVIGDTLAAEALGRFGHLFRIRVAHDRNFDCIAGFGRTLYGSSVTSEADDPDLVCCFVHVY